MAHAAHRSHLRRARYVVLSGHEAGLSSETSPEWGDRGLLKGSGSEGESVAQLGNRSGGGGQDQTQEDRARLRYHLARLRCDGAAGRVCPSLSVMLVRHAGLGATQSRNAEALQEGLLG